MTETLTKKKGLFIYTILFCVLFFLCFGGWLLYFDVSLFRILDGLEQHFISFLYVGRRIRQQISMAFSGNIGFQMYDPAMGAGSDVYLSNFGGITDPMYWLSAVVPGQYAEYMFDFIIILKLYLSGLVFLFFSYFRKQPVYAAICGSVIYAFCAEGYLILSESVCITWMYVFPLVMMAVIKMWEQGRKGLYYWILTFVFFCQFYFGYMIAILVAGYCVVRALFELKNKLITLKQCLCKARSFFFYGVMAFLSAGVCIMPVLASLLQNSRLGIEYYIPAFLYDKVYYEGLIPGFIDFYDMLGRDCFFGFAACVLPLVIYMFMNKGHSVLKMGFVFLTIGLMLPQFGSLMNGMSYASDRWIWSYCFLVSYIFTVTLPKIREMTEKNFIKIIILLAVYVIVCNVIGKPRVSFAIAVIILIASITVFYFVSKKKEKTFRIAAVAITCVSVIPPAFFAMHPEYGPVFDYDMVTAGEAYSMITDSSGASLFDDIGLEDGERYDSGSANHVRNASWYNGFQGFDFYMNMFPDKLDKFASTMMLRKTQIKGNFDGVDERPELEALLGVNYISMQSSDNTQIPGYSAVIAEGDTYYGEQKILASDTTHSLAYFFDYAVGESDFEKADANIKQMLFTHALVLEDDKATCKTEDFNLKSHEVEYSMRSGGTEINGIQYKVDKEYDYIALVTDDIAGQEVAICYEGLDYENGDATSTWVETYVLTKDGETTDPIGIYLYNYKHHLYGDRHDWYINLGTVPEDAAAIVVLFIYEGNYTIENISVYARDAEDISDNLSYLENACAPDDITWNSGENTYSLEVTCDRQRYLFLSIPYADGWTAYVDGEETEILCADIGFMAFDLDSGTHEIELRYKTPGLTSGLIISAVALLAGITSLAIDKKKSKV